MSSGEVIAAIAIVITVMSFLGGGMWWMAALFFSVKTNGTNIGRNYKTLKCVESSLEAHISPCDIDRSHLGDAAEEHEKRLNSHNDRLIKLED